MVSLNSMVLGLSAAAMYASAISASSVSALPTVALATFDYPSLTSGDAPQRLLQALSTDGIVALQNVPRYAALRARYLREAAQCAVLTDRDASADFVQRKLFADGTQRATISTNAGRELAGSAAATDAACPGFRELYEEFSQTIEHAVNTFGAALDHTAFTASDGHKPISSRRLVSDAVRLDHFHAYEAAAPSSAASTAVGADHRQLEMSLPLHEDHGLFIAMAAPKYFEVDESSLDGRRRLIERELAADASGLIIQTAAGDRVRPVLHGDEMVIMMGTGASRWLQTSHALPAVLHGMKMPEPMVASSEAGRRSLRAWFGKMTLLPAYQRMLATSTPFEAHVNATTRQLLTREDSELKTVGCATGRHLAPSDEKCTLKSCSTKPGATPPSEPCSVICNRKGHSANDAPDCAAKCTCSDVPVNGNVCWMLCVANLPENECSLDNQKCSGQSIVCSAAPTPTTTAPAPSTTRPAPGPGPAPGPAPGPTPAPGPGPAPGPAPTSGQSTNAPSSTPVAGSTPAPGSTSSAPATPGSSTNASAGSTSGSNASATTEPQAGETSTAKPSTSVPTPAPTKSSASAVAISTLAGVAAALASAVLL